MLLEIAPVVETPPLGQSADCRVFERRPCEVPTKCQPASLLAMKEPGWSATIRDISQGGVRLHVARRFEKGTPLAIELPGNRDHEASIVFVNVVYIKRLDDGSWVLGCRFVCELNEDELERLLTFESAAVIESSPPALRTETNSSEASTIMEHRILSDVRFQIAVEGGEPISGHFKSFNASKCWPLTAGKILRLNGHRGDQTKWSLKIQLIDCKQEANNWHVQAKLLPTSNAADLRQTLGSGTAH